MNVLDQVKSLRDATLDREQVAREHRAQLENLVRQAAEAGVKRPELAEASGMKPAEIRELLGPTKRPAARRKKTTRRRSPQKG